MTGPLDGLTIIELVGIGPGPFAGMMLADHGARVIAVERKGGGGQIPRDINRRGKDFVTLDLKDTADKARFLDLVREADALFEGFRPGVMEKLGLGPKDLAPINPRLVYGRMTGWGQDGPLAHTAGPDINYIALTGALEAMGERGAPPPVPLNLVGDYGGGAMMLCFGMLAALLDAQKTGKGRVVDAAITDGTISLMSLFMSLDASGLWSHARESNFLDGAAHFYGTYATKDDRFIAVGAMEPHFMATFLKRMDLPQDWLTDHMNPNKWSEFKIDLTERFKTRTRDEWAALFEGSDACVTPVLSLKEAPMHAHNQVRRSFHFKNGMLEPSPAPRYSPLDEN